MLKNTEQRKKSLAKRREELIKEFLNSIYEYQKTNGVSKYYITKNILQCSNVAIYKIENGDTSYKIDWIIEQLEKLGKKVTIKVTKK